MRNWVEQREPVKVQTKWIRCSVLAVIWVPAQAMREQTRNSVGEMLGVSIGGMDAAIGEQLFVAMKTGREIIAPGGRLPWKKSCFLPG